MSDTEEEKWLRGEPLVDAFEKLVEAQEAEVDFQPGRFPTDGLPESSLTPHLQMFADGIGQMQFRSELEKKAKRVLEAKMLRGELEARGIERNADGVAHAVLIPERFWIDAKISPTQSTARNGPREFTRISVLHRDFERLADPLPKPQKSQSGAARGRPSKGDQIIEAIAKCHAADSAHWDYSPEYRRGQYFRVLKETWGIDPARQPGFSEKTIAKYETKYKKLNN